MEEHQMLGQSSMSPLKEGVFLQICLRNLYYGFDFTVSDFQSSEKLVYINW